MFKMFNDNEIKAITSMIDATSDQYETSDGEIDYAGQGRKSPRVLESIKEKLIELDNVASFNAETLQHELIVKRQVSTILGGIVNNLQSSLKSMHDPTCDYVSCQDIFMSKSDASDEQLRELNALEDAIYTVLEKLRTIM